MLARGFALNKYSLSMVTNACLMYHHALSQAQARALERAPNGGYGTHAHAQTSSSSSSASSSHSSSSSSSTSSSASSSSSSQSDNNHHEINHNRHDNNNNNSNNHHHDLTALRLLEHYLALALQVTALRSIILILVTTYLT